MLQREIAHLLARPTEWPTQGPPVTYPDFAYQAQSWNVARSVVAKVEWHQGELFPRVGTVIGSNVPITHLQSDQMSVYDPTCSLRFQEVTGAPK